MKMLTDPWFDPWFAAFFVNIVDRNQGLLSFIRDVDHGSGRESGFENTFVKLFNDFRSERFSESISRLPQEFDSEIVSDLQLVLREASDLVQLPKEIAEKNSNVSVYRQQEMLEYLVRRIKERGPAYLGPVHPLSSDAYGSLLRVLKRIHIYFEKLPTADRSHIYFASLAVRWMDGTSYGELISKAYAFAKGKAKRGNPSIATVIRKVFEDVETDLRFRYVKYTKCYGDLLGCALLETGFDDWIPRIPALPFYLEMGASSETMLTILALGISRGSATILAERAPRPDMTKESLLRWMQQSRIVDTLPHVVRVEVEGII